MHKLKKLEWFDGWWRLLASREPAALSEIGSWEAAAAAGRRAAGATGGERGRDAKRGDAVDVADNRPR